MGNPVVHWEIQSKDPKKAQKFYGDLFGWKINADNPYNYGMVESGGEGGIPGGIGGAMGPSAVLVYTRVDDLQAYLDKAVQLGGKIAMPPTEIPGAVTMAIFTDPEGHHMGLIKG